MCDRKFFYVYNGGEFLHQRRNLAHQFHVGLSVKLHLRDRQTHKETRPFVCLSVYRCVWGRPSYKGDEAWCFIEIWGEDKNPESTNK